MTKSDQLSFIFPEECKAFSVVIQNSLRTLQRNLRHRWDSGATKLNNMIWHSYLIPMTKDALSYLDAKDYKSALGNIYALLMFMRQDPILDWLQNQEIYCEEGNETFINFFKSFGDACKRIFACSNQELGINQEFRTFVKETMQKLQFDINYYLEDLFESMCELDMVDMTDYVQDQDPPFWGKGSRK